jgi:hypothetical protein
VVGEVNRALGPKATAGERGFTPLTQGYANSAAQVRLPTFPSTGRFHGGP